MMNDIPFCWTKEFYLLKLFAKKNKLYNLIELYNTNKQRIGKLYLTILLRIATQYSYYDMMWFLLENGADPNGLNGDILINASKKGKEQCMKILVINKACLIQKASMPYQSRSKDKENRWYSTHGKLIKQSIERSMKI